MSARILDGRALAQDILADLRKLAAADAERHGELAGLAIVRVAGDPASDIYTHALAQTCERVGIVARVVDLPRETTDETLRATIAGLNVDDAVQGILTQLPLPPHLSQRTVAEELDPRKDVDGISFRSAGNLFLKLPSFVPATVAAVLELLDRSGVEIAGRRAVVVGASNVVGKPLALSLLHRDATVTVCHVYTEDLAQWTRQAEILVSAAGKAGLITAEMVRPGAVVIDVGINVQADGAIVGDVDFARVAEVSGAITPVPGGVGQLTNLMVIKQTLLARDLLDRDED